MSLQTLKSFDFYWDIFDSSHQVAYFRKIPSRSLNQIQIIETCLIAFREEVKKYICYFSFTYAFINHSIGVSFV